MILLSQWFTPEGETRAKELADVREVNESSGLFERCIYVDGSQKRWTYGDFLLLAAETCSGKPVVVANTDILFDSTIAVAGEMVGGKRMLAITRWENATSPRMIGHSVHDRFFSGSQDVWVFVGGQVHRPERAASIPLGVTGCENAFLGEMVAAGCGVLNPAIDVRTRHVHSEGSQQSPGSVPGVYAYPELSTLDGQGYVLTHPWPPGSTGEAQTEMFATWQR